MIEFIETFLIIIGGFFLFGIVLFGPIFLFFKYYPFELGSIDKKISFLIILKNTFLFLILFVSITTYTYPLYRTGTEKLLKKLDSNISLQDFDSYKECANSRDWNKRKILSENHVCDKLSDKRDTLFYFSILHGFLMAISVSFYFIFIYIIFHLTNPSFFIKKK